MMWRSLIISKIINLFKIKEFINSNKEIQAMLFNKLLLILFPIYISACSEVEHGNCYNNSKNLCRNVTKYIYKVYDYEYNKTIIVKPTTRPTSTTTTSISTTRPTTTTTPTPITTTTRPTTTTTRPSTTTTTATTTPTSTTTPSLITSGNRATLTYFDDQQLQCGTYSSNDLIVAINPKLLGVTDDQWLSLYANADPKDIPWCNRKLKIILNFVEYTFTIGDTCDPVGPTPQTPFAGGKCDYDDVIDFWNGNNFLVSLYGDNFYQGDVQWELI